MTRGTRRALRPPAAKDTANGNLGTRSLDVSTWHGIRRTLSPGLFRRARGVVSLHRCVPVARTHSRSTALHQDLSSFDGSPCMGGRSDRSVRHLSVVSRCTPARDDRPLNVSATPADVESRDYRLAFPWHGMEGACRLVRSHVDHDG